MEELKASADPAVMFGAHYFLSNLLPASLSRLLLQVMHRNSSLFVSNLQGCSTSLSVGSHRLHQIFYWPSPPPDVSISINMMSYQTKLLLSISTTSILIPCARTLSKLLHKHVNQLADLLSKRRVPGEVRAKKRPHHVIIEAPVGSGRGRLPTMMPVETTTGGGEHMATAAAAVVSVSASTSSGLAGFTRSSRAASVASPAASLSEMTDRLHAIQHELNDLNDAIESGILYDENGDSLSSRLEDLKDEFSVLMKSCRRRKSIADYGANAGPNIVINLEVSVQSFCMQPPPSPCIVLVGLLSASARVQYHVH